MLLFMESFDGALDGSQLLHKWGTATTFTLQAGSGRRASGNGFWTFGTQAEVGVNSSDTSIVGLAVNPLAPLTGVINLIEWGDPGSSVQCRLRINTNGTVEVLRSGTTSLGTSVATILTGAYTYLECKLFVHQTLGTVEVRLDNVTVLNLTNQDTQGSGVSSNIQSVDFGGNTGAGVRVDDLYIADDTGLVNNDFLGDCRVDTMAPASDTAIAEFDTSTPSANHWENVDEQPVDEDTSYVETPTNGDRDIFNLAALPVHPVPSQVLGVLPWGWVKKQQTGPVNIRCLVQPVATIYNQTTVGANAEDWKLVGQQDDILETNPETAAQWQESEVNATAVGMEVI